MRALSSPLRKQLETAVLAARRASEGASRAALDGLGVFLRDKPGHLDADQAAQRNGLRARWRQLGDDRELLVAECAYEQWHRLLFARFLAENTLLLHPKFRAPVTLAECEDYAPDLCEPDGWSVAARFAAEILPGIFRLDDPCVRLRLAPEGRQALEQILEGLPSEVFVADDALGWVYQFWQKDKKDEVNASERKIGGADLGPVTQLFTENYMVRFLLENSLGAWWAARRPESMLAKGFEYLRRDEDGSPSAGSFERWPNHVRDVTVMDPCCGSGHFLVEAFSMLWQMRMEEEGLSPVEAQDAVLRDNLFGLELDSRCVQIAMFAVALQAWKAGGGWRQLPVPNIACSGIPVRASVEEWQALAGGDSRLESSLVRLHVLFREADTLGSLIDPRRVAELVDPVGVQRSLDDVDWTAIAPMLRDVLEREVPDPAVAVLGADAKATARAALYLSNSYTIVATNVPYLSRSKQSEPLLRVGASQYRSGAPDLATMMIERCLALSCTNGSVAVVTPQNWQMQDSYGALRRKLLAETRWVLCARLGNNAWQSRFSGGVPFKLHTILIVFSNEPLSDGKFIGIDVGNESPPAEKGGRLLSTKSLVLSQGAQAYNPDSRIVFGEVNADLPRLSEFCHSFQGLKTGDDARFRRFVWEVPSMDGPWEFLRSSHVGTRPFDGCESIVLWQHGDGELARSEGARVVGGGAWGKRGVLVGQMGDLPSSLYLGELFDSNASPIIPNDRDLVPALWAYCSSAEYSAAVRMLDSSVGVKNRSLTAVPFDVDRWQRVAGERGPLPEPATDDPTQWLFKGRPETSTASLQVAVGRLLGYRWPDQAESDGLDEFGDADGIVCLPSVAGERPAADRVHQVLAAAFATEWSPAKLKELLDQASSKRTNLTEWLRDDFFKQHCVLFGNRPFVWHVSDGLRDGFSALVNYHRLDRKTLEKLTYTYLGQDWVERQRAGVRDEVAGAEDRLSAAVELQRRLEAVLDGEAPYDLCVRWKDPHDQPIGWEPDINDGVRMNIRPFVEAGVLKTFSPWPFKAALWRKDRGKNSDGTERHNDRHFTLAEKLDARKRAGRS